MPKKPTNIMGRVLLGYAEDGSSSEHLEIGMHPRFLLSYITFNHTLELAKDFDLHLGCITVSVPPVQAGKNYFIVCESTWLC
jgi:hypothetical protein